MQLISAISDGWRSERLRLLGNKITVQQCFERMEDVLALLLARDKLPVVEADAIIKEQFDGRYDDLVAMLVCRPFDLFVDFHHAVDQCLAFLFRDMQGFVYGIREESILLYVPAEGRAVQQLGMKGQAPSFGLERFAVVVVPDDLSRSDKYQGVFLVVILPASVLDEVGAFDILQVNRVDPHILACMPQRGNS